MLVKLFHVVIDFQERIDAVSAPEPTGRYIVCLRVYLHRKARDATARHNAFLEELGLPPLPIN
jgi:hypothetical protein